MKSRQHITVCVDTLSAILQAVAFAIIPIKFQTKPICQVFSYGIIAILYLVYFFGFREWIINRIVLKNGIDIEYIRKNNLARTFHSEILPQVEEILNYKEPVNEFDRYHLFIKWEDTTIYLTSHFWQDELCNVVRETQITYSNNTIYENELKFTVKALIYAYEENKEFKEVIETFCCNTLQAYVEKCYNILKKMLKAME